MKSGQQSKGRCSTRQSHRCAGFSVAHHGMQVKKEGPNTACGIRRRTFPISNEVYIMQMKLLASITLGLSAAMALPVPAAQKSQKGAVQVQTPASPRVMQQDNSRIRELPSLQPAAGLHARPVITSPVSDFRACCAKWLGDKIEMSAKFDVEGTGSPGNKVRVRVDLHNGDSTYSIKNERVTVNPQGHWRLRWVKVSSPDMNTNSGFIEINATEYFPATQVRTPDAEAHAKPVNLSFRTPAPPPSRQSHSEGH